MIYEAKLLNGDKCENVVMANNKRHAKNEFRRAWGVKVASVSLCRDGAKGRCLSPEHCRWILARDRYDEEAAARLDESSGIYATNSAWDLDPDRDIMKELQDTRDKMLAIMGGPIQKQAFVFTDDELAVLKSIVKPQTASDCMPSFGGIEVHSRKTVAECQELTALLRAQGYEVTTTEHPRYEPLDLEWPHIDATEPIPPYQFLWEDPDARLGVPARILYGNAQLGSNYAAARQDYERFFGSPAKQPQAQAEEDH